MTSFPHSLTGITPPASMTTEAQAKWRQLLPRLDVLNITDQEHLDLLAVYCEAVATFHEATTRLSQHGYLARVGKSVFQSPWVGIRDGAVIQMTQLATRLGFSPDAPLAARMPSFAEYAGSVSGSDSNAAGDNYEIVEADGTVSVLHD